jgi:hypothetical protein
LLRVDATLALSAAAGLALFATALAAAACGGEAASTGPPTTGSTTPSSGAGAGDAAASTGAGGAASGSGGSTGGSAPDYRVCDNPPSDYPEGPYGYEVGETVAPLSFQGYVDGVLQAWSSDAIRTSGVPHVMLHLAATW